MQDLVADLGARLASAAGRLISSGADPRLTPPATTRDAAVIDIGSNTVRLVVYRIEGAALTPLLNDKEPAGLGRVLAATGRLDPEGVRRALFALDRFRGQIDARGLKDVIVAATAAVRDAEDGAAFKAWAEERIGVPLRVLSGPEEGRLSAEGVLAGDPSAEGLVGDLGGSSLELTEVAHGRAGEGATLPLGPLALAAESAADLKALRKKVDDYLIASAPRRAPGGVFHAVGGAWRNLARIDMIERRYPLHILHGYAMPAAEAAATARLLSKKNPAALDAYAPVSKRRLTTLHLTAVVMERVIEHYTFDKVVVSAYGLREGLLRSAAPEPERQGDPLLAYASAAARRSGGDPNFGAALASWIAPLAERFAPAFGPERDALLRAVVCRLADLGGARHPDHRAELTAADMLFAPAAAISHAERTFLALSLFNRYASIEPGPPLAACLALLGPGQTLAARQLGRALRLAGDLSGRVEQALRRTRLVWRGDSVVVAIEGDAAYLATDTVLKRAGQLAEVLGAPVVIDVV